MGTPSSLTFAIPVVPPLDLSGKTSWEVLNLARKAGLDDFCLDVERRGGEISISFHLDATETSTIWHVRGRGWDNAGEIALFEMEVDGVSGEMLRRNFSRLR
jgi:hypothetical protein